MEAGKIRPKIRARVHLVAEPDENWNDFFIRVLASDYKVIKVEQDGRVLVEETQWQD